ncbi:MAG TPA: hypothetical protein PLO87_03725 [Ornithinibacter sp.]|nr:hypothetical protein [Dermatophilaceae bacterium]HOB79388.1 hypothetical protein [Ornithinibacter sp.]MBU9943637.1 hypothetical protein [Dermatophilaceae bacterium]HQA13124.1 hypothetical protein [Ornithinibacter sp.]HQD67683.1 hypothetical protein [Ornithinibacter sp.]
MTGDPRTLALHVPLEVLEAVALDPRLALTTTSEVVAAGQRLRQWSDLPG